MSSSDAFSITNFSRDSASDQPKVYQWILHPVIDLLFCCGGFVWILFFAFAGLGLTTSLDSIPQAMLWTAWIIGVHFFANAHSAAAWQRVFFDKEIIQQSGRYILFCTVLCALLIPASLFFDWAAGWIVRIYSVILVKHFVMQSYGVVLIYCMKRNYSLSKTERHITLAVFHATLYFVVARLLSSPEYAGTQFFNVDIPSCNVCPQWLFTVVLCGFVATVLVFAAMVLRRYFKSNELFPLPGLLLVFTTVCIYFMKISNDPTFGILLSAYYHGAQNIAVIMSYEIKKSGLPKEMPVDKIITQVWTKKYISYFFSLAAVGIVLFVVLPRLASAFLGVNQDLAIVTALVCFGTHHILTEAVAWRLRDPRVRKLMI